jgi:hypothetical protein
MVDSVRLWFIDKYGSLLCIILCLFIGLARIMSYNQVIGFGSSGVSSSWDSIVAL